MKDFLFREDQIYHIIIGFLIVSMHAPLYVTIPLAIIIFFLKETYDKLIKKEIFDWSDIGADAVGLGFGLIYRILMLGIFNY